MEQIFDAKERHLSKILEKFFNNSSNITMHNLFIRQRFSLEKSYLIQIRFNSMMN